MSFSTRLHVYLNDKHKCCILVVYVQSVYQLASNRVNPEFQTATLLFLNLPHLLGLYFDLLCFSECLLTYPTEWASTCFF